MSVKDDCHPALQLVEVKLLAHAQAGSMQEQGCSGNARPSSVKLLARLSLKRRDPNCEGTSCEISV
eukprot:219593-Pyramimonas_sp.AAC.1